MFEPKIKTLEGGNGAGAQGCVLQLEDGHLVYVAEVEVTQIVNPFENNNIRVAEEGEQLGSPAIELETKLEFIIVLEIGLVLQNLEHIRHKVGQPSLLKRINVEVFVKV